MRCQEGAPEIVKPILTKSNAATLSLFKLFGDTLAAGVFDGSNLPTKSVLGVSSFGARSCQEIFSGDFCDAGVKNDATAVSVT